ncbi:MAG TPA: hypothetical protein VHW74_11005 [Mycobacteriales bacterium]|jgi:hypothetical protein|nr:hypothetical protein [Mycobacteriales bacterium]
MATDTACAASIAYWVGKPPIRGLNHFERFFGLDRYRAGLVRETVRRS